MGFGGFHGDFNIGRASNRRHPPDIGSSGGFQQSLDTNPFLKKNQCYDKVNTESDGLDLCKKLNKMGISCDMSIWSRPGPIRVDPDDCGSSRTLRGFDENPDGAFGSRNDYSAHQVFLRNTSHGVSPAELRFLGVQDSVNPDGFREMMALKNNRDFLLDRTNRPMKRSSPCLKSVSLGNNAFQGSLMFERNRVSRPVLPAIEGAGDLGAYYQQDSFRGFSLGNDPLMCGGRKRASRALAAMEGPGASSYPQDSVRFVGNDAFMFEGKRVSRALVAMEGPGASYAEDSLRGISLANDTLMFEGKRISRALAAMEGSGASLMGPKTTSDLPLDLASMVNIYGSVNLMAKDQIGCRVLQKLVDDGMFVDALFLEISNHVVELSMNPFGNYLVQKLLDACNEEQRTVIVGVLTSKPMELVKICLNNYGTRVVQKMIETVKTKQQIGMVKSGLEPGFMSLVKDLNGNHVIQTCLTSLGPNDNKFVLDAATKYCAEIATHRHGCCVLQCCVSNSVGEQRERLVNEISRNSLRLSQDPFGNYVVQYLIEQKVSAVKLLTQFRMHYAELATQKFSSHVMEKCLRIYPESRAEIVRELLSVPNFEHLVHDPFGNYVIQTALSVTKGPVRASLVEKVHKYGKLKFSPYCKKIFSKTILKR